MDHLVTPSIAYAHRRISACFGRCELNRAGFPEEFRLSHDLGVVTSLRLGGWHVADRLEQPAVVEPVDPFQRGELDSLALSEPPRVSRRLQLLRGWNHDEANTPVFP